MRMHTGDQARKPRRFGEGRGIRTRGTDPAHDPLHGGHTAMVRRAPILINTGRESAEKSRYTASMRPNWLIVGLVGAMMLALAAAAIGWNKYFTFKQESEYQIAKSIFIEDHRLASAKYAPATVVQTDGNRLTYRVPKQVVRNGEIYVDSELQTAIVSDATDLFTFASTSLGMTVYTIPPGTSIRILAPPSPEDPDIRYAQLIYINADAVVPEQ